MNHPRSPDRCRRRRRYLRRAVERGAALVEMTLILPLLSLLCLGLVEMGMAWQDTITAEQATRIGARAGVGLTGDERADRQTLLSLVSVLEPDELAQVDYVVIFDATDSPDVPAGCTTASNPGLRCNRYTQAQLSRLSVESEWGCGAGSHDTAWCPADRDSVLTDPTYLGVHIRSRRPWITGIFPTEGLDFEATTVMSLIPADY